MLKTVRQMKEMTVHVLDGVIGAVQDCCFDDQIWAIRYLIVHSSGWMRGRSVLISPIFVCGSEWGRGALHLSLTKQQIDACPGVDRLYPPDPHLRCTAEVTGYRIDTDEGKLGRIADFIVDPETWSIRYVEASTGNWLARHEVLLASRWICAVDDHAARVSVDVPACVIESAPKFVESLPITREYESRVYQHFRREPYWTPDIRQ